MMGFLGFGADEVFGSLMEVLSKVGLLIPSLFLLDRLTSYYFGPAMFSDILNWVVESIYFERLDILVLVNFFIISILLMLFIYGTVIFMVSFIV